MIRNVRCLLLKPVDLPPHVLHSIRRSSDSSHRWLTRQAKDPFVNAARHAKYRARSAFKLIQIDDKYAFLQPGAVVIDCGASPGSWSQIAVERTNSDGRSPRKKKGEVIAVDLQPIHPLPGLTIVAPADFTHESTLKKLKEILNDRRVDVVMSDMSPRASGMKSLDQDVSLELCKSVFRYALEVLSPGKGVFLCKMIFGGDASSFMREVKSAFEAASFVKPAASRSDSSEIFLIGLRKRAS